MFGISFGELLLIGLIALLVLGPERLPGAARTAGLWIGRLKRSFNAIKTEVEREIGADEIRRQLHNEHIMALEKQIKESIVPPTVESLLSEAEPEGDSAPASPAPGAPAAQTVQAAPAPATAKAPATPGTAAPSQTDPAAPVQASNAASPSQPSPQAPIEPQQPSRIP
ncbi:Sec-independent protein translocase protein TatB [Pseudomonas sp. JS3066]|jgi:sec-independent protein translocase protein TatB|uniref:Sec-independent protein translocase protein TatB n=1 Tax=unclassified Pseudomonas TaxID=196821 RepID=UPI000EA8B9E4|nr:MULTISPECIES: Sec-independent protein translocase protein TatB [unclassified Pseudomonas]AYF89678.1 Sec-independent protein translocase subunit TatB [Pseudomonas sp. DY-1]MDH4655071.1 Sec-independent protein translocase subunit TatB [Pseudomonas sp. BN606]MRK20413.1 Sec-independent protein translocase subunit TatB [Pseudomonas sp. JG-B]WVK92750.1 Sec-independent protein translocase protein TatB [Pseudomonas sp. JS3066]